MMERPEKKAGRRTELAALRQELEALKEASSRRERLLEGIAQSTRALMGMADFDTAIREVLHCLGLALDVDRVCLFECRGDVTAEQEPANPQYEWARPDVLPRHGHPAARNELYCAMLHRWHAILQSGPAVAAVSDQLPEEERRCLEELGVRSSITLPIPAEGFSGFISFHDCHSERQWTDGELTILATMAATLGGALLRHKAQEALQRSEIRYRTLAANLPGCAVVMFDAGLRVMMAEGPELEAQGFPRETLIGKEFSRLRDAELLSWLEPHARRVVSGRSTSGEIPFHDQCYLFQGAPLKNDRGATYGGIAVLQNITARKQAEEILRRMSRMEATATLAGGIAHDFNNLMVGVLGNAEMLRADHPAPPDTGEMLAEIVDSARRASDLAQLMLAYAGGGKLHAQRLCLNTVIHEVLRRHAGVFGDGITVEERLVRGLWPVMADLAQIRQVVANLCINAGEAVSRDGRVTVSTHNVALDAPKDDPPVRIPPGRYVLLTVEDTGKGMEPDTLRRIFEPFFTTKFQGRGLGLAAAYGIVSNHEGFIAVQTRAGAGTVFRVYLPACEQTEQLPKAGAERAYAGTETVLVIDDEEPVLQFVQRTLERVGYTVLCARHGLEAIHLARTHEGDIQVALLDLNMPAMSGFDAFPLLREARPEMKIIICTGYDIDTATRRMFKEGACTFLRKPFSSDSLGRALCKVLDRSGPWDLKGPGRGE